MSIRARLVLSYAAMLLIPIVLLALTSRALRYYYVEAPYKRTDRGFSERHESTFRQKILRQLNLFLIQRPESLEDPESVRKLEQELPIAIKGIILRKESDLVYVSESLKSENLAGGLAPFGSISTSFREPRRSSKERHRFFKIWSAPYQWDFYFQDGARGSFFLFTSFHDPGESFPLNLILPVTTILVLILTNGFLTFLVSRSILKPMAALKSAAERIKDGDLDSSLAYSRRDEIGEVTRAFEEMRVRLKGSLSRQIEYEENRKQLISNISHDLRTPITAIKGYIEGIRDGVANTTEKRERYLSTIYSKAVLMDRLIDQLFFYSKLDLKSVSFRFERLELCSFLEATCEELSSDYKDLNLDSKNLHDRSVFVKADRTHMKRVLSNLIDNAVKYNDKETPLVKIEVKEEPGWVTVIVSDNGPGIEKEALNNVFDRFFRNDPSRNTDVPGSGLGLAITREIIEAHGGRIWAEGDEGAAICFRLERI